MSKAVFAKVFLGTKLQSLTAVIYTHVVMYASNVANAVVILAYTIVMWRDVYSQLKKGKNPSNKH